MDNKWFPRSWCSLHGQLSKINSLTSKGPRVNITLKIFSTHSSGLKRALLPGKQLGFQLCNKHWSPMGTNDDRLKFCMTSRPKKRQRQHKVPTICRGQKMNFKHVSLEQHVQTPFIMLYATGLIFRNAHNWDLWCAWFHWKWGGTLRWNKLIRVLY